LEQEKKVILRIGALMVIGDEHPRTIHQKITKNIQVNKSYVITPEKFEGQASLP